MLDIQVGKKFRTRDGDIITIKRGIPDHDLYKWYGETGWSAANLMGYYYTGDGHIFADRKYQPHALDLDHEA